MFSETVHDILGNAQEKRILIVGDFAVDTYYHMNSEPEEPIVSVETGQTIGIATRARFELGGAGNVAANLTASSSVVVDAVGLIGDDRFGRVLIQLLDERGVRTGGIRCTSNIHTPVYTKFVENNREVNRIDIGSVQTLEPEDIQLFLGALQERFLEADLVIINQQIKDGYLGSQEVHRRLLGLLRSRSNVPVVVDSRDFADRFDGCIRKLNQAEAYELVPDAAGADWRWDPARAADLGRRLVERWKAPVIITRGSHGAVVVDSAATSLEGVRVSGRTDTVGAGDSFLAGCALGLAAGSGLEQAARLGTLVAAVTIRKLFRTGTAAPEELHKIAAEAQLNYQPELLYRPAPATAAETLTTIEVLIKQTPLPFKYAVFDHDGTVSVLRQGWEGVMRRHMFRAIAGDPPGCDPARQQAVRKRIDTFIEETTGVQTIIQMHGLVDMVREEGIVPAGDIKTAAAYKADYVADLRRTVDIRLEQLADGLRTVEDFTVKGAVPFLHRLRERGVTLFLASGTDSPDTQREAAILGYADLFAEILGSVDDTERDPKAVVLSSLLQKVPTLDQGHVLVFGDGPVEIREGRKRGCRTVGVLSDEVRRFGWNAGKRPRLVSAGASLLIPDFSDTDTLERTLWGN